METMISRYDPTTEFATPERCRITELLNRPDSASVSMALARVAPGVTTQLHALREINECYLVIEGTGRIEVEGIGGATIQRLDVVVVPAGAAQRIQNVGAQDLLFVCICTPRFVPGAYEVLE
jgi:mannose-6-phosphate isomerase-like protein (cupin superfamily)